MKPWMHFGSLSVRIQTSTDVKLLSLTANQLSFKYHVTENDITATLKTPHQSTFAIDKILNMKIYISAPIKCP